MQAFTSKIQEFAGTIHILVKCKPLPVKYKNLLAQYKHLLVKRKHLVITQSVYKFLKPSLPFVGKFCPRRND